MSEFRFGEALSGFSQEEHKDRILYSKRIYFTAWVVEILAALLGLYIAWSQGYQAYVSLGEGEQDVGAMFRAIGGGLAFAIIAVLEPTKIFLAYGLYHGKIWFWRLFFFLALASLTLVTFESMLNGLVQQNVNISQQAERVRNDRQEISEKIKINRETVAQYRLHTSDYINSLSEKSDQNTSDNHKNEMSNLQRDFEMRRNDLQEKIDNFSRQKNKAAQTNRKRIADVDAEIEKFRTNRDNDINNLREKFERRIKPERERRTTLEKNQANELADATSTSTFGRIGEAGRKAQIENRHQQKISRIDQTIREININLDNEIARINIPFQNKIEEAESRRKVLIEKSNSAGEKSDADIEKQIAQVQKEENELEINYKKTREQREFEFSELRGKIEKRKNTQLEDAALNEKRIAPLEKSYEELIKADTQLKHDYRHEVSKIQLYQFTSMVCGFFLEWCLGTDEAADSTVGTEIYKIELSGEKLDIADLPEEKVKTVSTIWFGSIAWIASTMGTFLALAAFVLRDPDVFKYRSRRTLRKALLHLTIRIAQLLRRIGEGLRELGVRIGDGGRELGIRVGDGVRYLLKTIGNTITLLGQGLTHILRGIAYLIADLRRSIRAPKIREVPVEIEKVVEKEVEKIVEVERVVFKEVPKEIVHKELVYVPLYSMDNAPIKDDKIKDDEEADDE